MTTLANPGRDVCSESFACCEKKQEEFLHYEFFTQTKESYSKLKALRDVARNFTLRTSKIYRLFAQDCLISSQNDPLLDLKLQSKQMVMIGNDVRMLSPITTLAFACQMHNDQIMYLGLNEYPETIEHKDVHVKVIKSPGMMWKGFMQLSVQGFVSKSCCVRSKINAIAIMRAASTIGLLRTYSIS